MSAKLIRWALFIVPALVIGTFETIRHTVLENVLPMEIGNWVTATIDAIVIAIVSRSLFQRLLKSESELNEAKKFQAVFEERERLSRTLHDQIAQSVFYSGVQVNAALMNARAIGDMDLQLKLNDILLSLREIDDNVRQEIFNLKHNHSNPQTFEQRIRAYLTRILSQTGIKWTVSFPTSVTLSTSEEVQLFGILQEGITNVIKHSQATEVEVRFESGSNQHDMWTFTIKDNGAGGEGVREKSEGFGLDIVSSRARDIGANAIFSGGTKGATLKISKIRTSVKVIKY